jgi:hypothetical protein
VLVSFFATLAFSAEIVGADAFSAAQKALEAVKENCYPDINAESLKIPEISTDGVLSSISIGVNGATNAYVINPQYLMCGDKVAELCGSRGCPISIFAGEQSFEYVGWQSANVMYGNTVLMLLLQQGWACGHLANGETCYSILSWDDQVENFVHHSLWGSE